PGDLDVLEVAHGLPAGARVAEPKGDFLAGDLGRRPVRVIGIPAPTGAPGREGEREGEGGGAWAAQRRRGVYRPGGGSSKEEAGGKRDCAQKAVQPADLANPWQVCACPHT